eukprot:TRINITY_DN9389_c0_g1_i18.p1 TRINITY_DN9389_c0_g1~~TRINITY_DN9389_c0_g1_i18.p1  ORF type:complete len:262 (-),score=26.33 TRINITY_DN9389_c0_g1_i18:484-1269(-)
MHFLMVISKKMYICAFLRGFPLSSRVLLPNYDVLSMASNKPPEHGLKNSNNALSHLGFHPSSYDPSMFLHHASTRITILLVYVDDIIITGTDADMIHQLQASLHESFHMKDLGPLNYFLGLEVHQFAKGIVLHQHKYALDLIEMAGLQGSAPVNTPVEVNVKLQQDSGDPLFDPTLYRRLVGSLIYLTITRPDISYAVNLVSQFMTDPRHRHLAMVRRIIKYLIRTPTHGLFYPANNSLTLKAYSDADWADCQDTRHSTTG